MGVQGGQGTGHEQGAARGSVSLGQGPKQEAEVK